MLISWLIVAGIVVGTFMPDILNGLDKLGQGFRDLVRVWVVGMRWLYYDLPYHTQRVYRAYRHTGKHRMREQAPDDSEVDSWPGADEDWTMILHGLNAQTGRMREEVRV